MKWVGIFVALAVLAGLSFAVLLPPGSLIGCSVISSPGNYTLLNSVSGSPYAYSGSYSACILINSSNVALDCQGNNIYVGNASYPTGIALTNVTNVAVKNCNILNSTTASYPTGINLVGVTRGNFTNNTIDSLYYGIWGGMASVPNSNNRFVGNAISNATYGIYWPAGSASDGYSSFISNRLSDITLSGYGQAFYETSGHNNYTGNSVDTAGAGFRIAGPYNNLTGNTVTGLTAYNNAFLVQNADYNWLSDNSALDNQGNGFAFYTTNHTTAIDNTALNNSGDGFVINDLPLLSNAVLRGNNATQNGYNGFHLVNTDNNVLTNNVAINNSNDGFLVADTGLIPLSYNNLTSNTANYNGNNGFEMSYTDHNTLKDNTAFGNIHNGFRVHDSGYNLLESNLAYENDWDGFYVDDAIPESYNNLTSNLAHDNGENGFHLWQADHEVLDRNTAANNSNDGFLVETGFLLASYNNLTNNVAYGNDNNGFEFFGEDNSLLQENTAYQNSENGFALLMNYNEQGSDYNTLIRNTAYENGWNGFYLENSGNSYMENSTAHDNSENGISLQYSSDNTILSTTSYNNGGEGGSGFYLTFGSDNNNVTDMKTYSNRFAGVEEENAFSGNIFTNVQAYGNLYGVYLGYDDAETFINLTAHDNQYAGIYERTSLSPALTVLDSWLYWNGWEVIQDSYNSVPFTFNNSRIGPAGMRVAIQDEIGSGGGGYSYNETTSPGPAPPNLSSFHSKYLDVYFTGDLGINTTTFSWTDPEVSGFDESTIALYTWNGSGWYLTPNQTLDTANNSLTALNLSTPVQFQDQIYGLFAVLVPTSPGGDNGVSSSLSVGLQSNCSGNTVTVTSSGTPIEGADVMVNGDSVGTTDQNGQATFEGCGTDVIVRAVQGGYEDGTLSTSLIACGQCTPPKCQNDSDCATDQKCQLNDNPQLNQCVPLSCACGQVAQDHECTGPVYQCGTGANCAQCPGGQICNANHECVPSGCTSDLQCKDNEVCRTASGAPGTANTPGSCQNVTGECGIATNHTFVPYGYECGTEPGCPSCASGQSCVDHKCVQNDITCPSTVVVGDNANCQVTQNNQACGPADNCTTVVTAPDGTNTTVPPDDAGNVLIGATIQGRYRIDLLKNGQVVKEVFVDVVPKSQPTEQQPPTSAGGSDILSMVWLLLLLLIVIGAVVYWRTRSKK